jgi:hypothetical protein
MAEEQEQPERQRRTPNRARLPQTTLNDAGIIAFALSDLAGPASAPIIAQHLHVSAASSGFNTKLAAAGYFGLITKKEGKYELTNLGHGFTSDDAGNKKASGQAALMSTNFGRLIHVLRGRSVNEETISARLQSDLDVPVASAKQIARVLVTSAEQVGILTDGRFNAEEIETAIASLPEKPSETVSRRTPTAPTEKRPESATKTRVKEVQTESRLPFGLGRSSISPLNLEVRLDVSHLSVDEIVELIKKLRVSPAEEQST